MDLSKHRVLGFGEVLWDVFPNGERLGGAPANFAAQAASIGAEAFLVSCLGRDQRGDEAVRRLGQHLVSADYVFRCDKPTGTVEVTLVDGQPQYRIGEDVAWDNCSWRASLDSFARSVDAICFGTLFQRSSLSRQTLRQFLQSTREDCLRVFDVNLRQDFYDKETVLTSLELANVLKLSDEELPVVAEIVGIDAEPRSASKELLAKYELEVVALTCGAEGALLTSVREQNHCPALEIEVSDTVGAGDAFSASLAMGLLQRHSLETLNEDANHAAADACLRSGGM